MPDTKIKKITNGTWIDVDDPINEYSVRRSARSARRQRLLDIQHNSVLKYATNKITNIQLTTDPKTVAWTPLQHKLYSRMTSQQNVAHDEAINIISSNGYNKAASYGHMREAGATATQAEIVISLEVPELSLAYGKNRAQGFDHADAMNLAVEDINKW